MCCPNLFKNRGFTLIELLVTISIIAVLSAVGMVAYSSVIKQGRDSKRQSDLRSIQSALEQYYHDQLFYPSQLTAGQAMTNCTGNPKPGCSATRTYLNTVPTPPSGSSYDYASLPWDNDSTHCDNTATTKSCTSYCLYADMENTVTSGTPTGTCKTLQDRGSIRTADDFAITPP